MRHTIRRTLSKVALGVLLVAGAYPGFSQSQSINGTIRGVVTDTTGSPIAGAKITVKNLDTGFTRETTTASDGVYIAPDPPIGNYSVQTTSGGFAGITQTGVHLDAGTSATVDQQLKP